MSKSRVGTISIGGLQSLGISPEFLALQREFPSIELPQQQAKDFLSRVQDAPEGAAKHFLSAALYSGPQRELCFEFALAFWLLSFQPREWTGAL